MPAALCKEPYLRINSPWVDQAGLYVPSRQSVAMPMLGRGREYLWRLPMHLLPVLRPTDWAGNIKEADMQE